MRPSFVIRHWSFVICALLAFATSALSAEKRLISEKDLFDFVWIGDHQVSPDGSRVAFVRVTTNEKKEGYNTAIWMVNTAGNEPAHRLTNGDHDASPRWSPDGKFLLFVRATEKEGKPEPPQLCMLPMTGGDAFSFTDLPKGAAQPEWSPDGKSIAFSSGTNADDLTKQEKKKRKEEELKQAVNASSSPRVSPAPRTAASSPSKSSVSAAESAVQKAEKEGEHESDVRVITRAVNREDNEGYLDFKHPQHIWVIAAPHSADEKVQPKQITFGRFDEGNVLWTRDASQILFTSLRVDEPYYETPRTELYAVSPNGGEPSKLNTFDMAVDNLSLSPDGKQLAFVASATQPVNSYTQPDLWIVDVSANAKPRNVTGQFDFDFGSGVFGDSAAPRGGGGNKPVWTSDGKNIIDVYGKQGRTILASFDVATGTPTDLTRGNQAVVRFRVSGTGILPVNSADHRLSTFADGQTRRGEASPSAGGQDADATSKIVYSVSTATAINDLFAIDRTGGEPKRLTNVNDELFSQLSLTEPEEISYTSFDGKKIQAWLQKPPNFSAAKKYPLILNIHGGPHAAYGYIFEHEFQWMAAKGYIVLYPNPRGSTTYGQDFGNVIQYHYPGDDFKDLMAGVDEAIHKGNVDEKKMGVTGGSGGGLLTNWVVGHTKRFAAAVAQRDIASWSAWWYTADFTLFQPNWFKGPPFDQKEDYESRSPLTYIKEVQTPMMFILGDADSRTPPSAGGEMMFRALKFRKIPAVMVQFPNESHELSRSGGPWHRVERLEHIVGWFDHWLMGVPKPEYEIGQDEVSVKQATGRGER